MNIDIQISLFAFLPHWSQSFWNLVSYFFTTFLKLPEHCHSLNCVNITHFTTINSNWKKLKINVCVHTHAHSKKKPTYSTHKNKPQTKTWTHTHKTCVMNHKPEGEKKHFGLNKETAVTDFSILMKSFVCKLYTMYSVCSTVLKKDYFHF